MTLCNVSSENGWPPNLQLVQIIENVRPIALTCIPLHLFALNRCGHPWVTITGLCTIARLTTQTVDQYNENTGRSGRRLGGACVSNAQNGDRSGRSEVSQLVCNTEQFTRRTLGSRNPCLFRGWKVHWDYLPYFRDNLTISFQGASSQRHSDYSRVGKRKTGKPTHQHLLVNFAARACPRSDSEAAVLLQMEQKRIEITNQKRVKHCIYIGAEVAHIQALAIHAQRNDECSDSLGNENLQIVHHKR